MSLAVGNDLKLYYNTGTDASPTWSEICQTGDISVDLSCNDAEVDLRCTNWLLNLPAKLSGGINLKLAFNPGNTVYDALRGMFFSRTVKQFAVANGAIATTGTEYFKAFAYFSSFNWSLATQEMSSHDAKLSLAYEEESGSLVEPAWGTIS